MQIIAFFLFLTITTIRLHANGGLSHFEFQDTLAYNDHEFDAGSKIDSIVLDENKLRNLHSLGIVWGFLKYYHPGVAKGNYNWDYELFRILPKIIHARDVKEVDAILVAWIRNMGEFERGKKPKIATAQIKLKPDLNWIKEFSFSNELKSLLLKLEKAMELINQ